MAKQAGTYHITGCKGNLCFYKMDGKYYVRMKSSLTGKRVKKSPAFKRTMQYAALLADASKIASALYKTLPTDSKGIEVFRMLSGKAMKLLQNGKDEVKNLFLHSAAIKTEKRIIKQKERSLFPDYSYANAVIGKALTDTAIIEEPRQLSLEELPP